MVRLLEVVQTNQLGSTCLRSTDALFLRLSLIKCCQFLQRLPSLGLSNYFFLIAFQGNFNPIT